MPKSTSLLLAPFLLYGSVSLAFDRIKVSVPPPGQEAAEQLVGSLAASCNSGDYLDFMSHFTPSYGRRVRRRMEDLFITQQPQMRIHKVMLLSEEKDTIAFAVRYAWHDKHRPEEIVASKVTAKKVDGHWKLDGEIVKAISRTTFESESVDQPAHVADQAAWNPFNPPARAINPFVEHLRGDVGIQPGLGCADGRCGR